MIRREEFCGGRLIKEIDQVDVSTSSLQAVYADGSWRWLLDGQEIRHRDAEALISAWKISQDFTDQMTKLTTSTGTGHVDLRNLQSAILELGQIAPDSQDDALPLATTVAGRHVLELHRKDFLQRLDAQREAIAAQLAGQLPEDSPDVDGLLAAEGPAEP